MFMARAANMFVQRMLAVEDLLREKGAGVFWLPNRERSGQPGTAYLSGFSGSSSDLFVTPRGAHFLTDGRYLAAAAGEVAGAIAVHAAAVPPLAFLKKLLGRRREKRVLVDGAAFSLALADRARAALPGLSFADLPGMLQVLRRTKDSRERELLRNAAAITAKAFRDLAAFIRPGATERALARKASDLLREHGAEGDAFDPIVASGPNGAFPHAVPTERRIRKGELVILDFGARAGGYVADMTRTVALGALPRKLERMYEAVREAEEEGMRAARAGLPCARLDGICRTALRRRGFGRFFPHATGHGIGMEIHELPVIGPRSEEPLAAGDAVTCEPGVYLPGVGGVRIEDSLLIGECGAENLTAAIPKTLFL